ALFSRADFAAARRKAHAAAAIFRRLAKEADKKNAAVLRKLAALADSGTAALEKLSTITHGFAGQSAVAKKRSVAARTAYRRCARRRSRGRSGACRADSRRADTLIR